MQDLSVPVYFYVPSANLVKSVPDDVSGYWGWINLAVKRAPAYRSNDKALCTWVGPYNWTIQTYLYLKNSGFTCSLTASLPEQGVILSHSDFLPRLLKPTSQQFIVEIKPDRDLSCLYANFVIVQNRHDPIQFGSRRAWIGTEYVKYWPQPGLIPRDESRGDVFQNVCFVGNPEQFLSSSEQLAADLKRLGLTWEMVPRERWHDYSSMDAVVAVREPATSLAAAHMSVDRKPATKLYNAWLAGVPAILSPEISFQELRRSRLDFLEAKNIDDILDAIKLLMRNSSLRHSMINNGRIRGKEFSPEKIAQDWIKLLREKILPQYLDWRRSTLRRRGFFLARECADKLFS